MIIEELIHFDREKLRSAESPEDRLLMIKDFFAGFPPTSDEKLAFMIMELKTRQAEESPYSYRTFKNLLSGCLLLSLFALMLSFFPTLPLTGIKQDLQNAVIIQVTAWTILNVYIRYARQARPYKRLIRTLELYDEERGACQYPLPKSS
ncbi:hypothetical protein [Mucilaginibacter kameinonensis]|uniref:hypothetical protein n=1 Tax=Mucilaginibacter kameinonensis TaxID=452286 RepID=UPI000EF7C1ED|nr:hypothetical protein [Mucilaginibacter kameinonensis]